MGEHFRLAWRDSAGVMADPVGSGCLVVRPIMRMLVFVDLLFMRHVGEAGGDG